MSTLQTKNIDTLPTPPGAGRPLPLLEVVVLVVIVRATICCRLGRRLLTPMVVPVVVPPVRAGRRRSAAIARGDHVLARPSFTSIVPNSSAR
eukprot:scaffold3_cov389-Prasinococcus_capsulatus_cf.AAC.2